MIKSAQGRSSAGSRPNFLPKKTGRIDGQERRKRGALTSSSAPRGRRRRRRRRKLCGGAKTGSSSAPAGDGEAENYAAAEAAPGGFSVQAKQQQRARRLGAGTIRDSTGGGIRRRPAGWGRRKSARRGVNRAREGGRRQELIFIFLIFSHSFGWHAASAVL